MLPACVVGVGDESRKPLGEKENVGVAFREMLEAIAAADAGVVDDIERPVDFE